MYTPINGWTKQLILDHIEKEFKGKSLQNDGSCLYRGENGRKCAAGIFIPDSLYSHRLENKTIHSLMDKNYSEYNESITNVMPLEVTAMMRLQDIHDTGNEETIKSEMINCVKENVKDN